SFRCATGHRAGHGTPVNGTVAPTVTPRSLAPARRRGSATKSFGGDVAVVVGDSFGGRAGGERASSASRHHEAPREPPPVGRDVPESASGDVNAGEPPPPCVPSVPEAPGIRAGRGRRQPSQRDP